MAKASLHSGGASSGSAKHNDKKRDFKKVSNSQNLDYINDEKSQDNLNLMFMNGQFVITERDLQVVAHERYTEVFGKALEEQNQKSINARHMERVKTIDDWMTDSKHGPRETILQIGSDENKATKNGKELSPEELKQELFSCFTELNSYMEEILGEHYQPIHAAIHMDELTPHMHWDYSIAEHDSKTGTLKPGLNKGLEQAGIDLPNPERVSEIQKLEQEKENERAEANGEKPKKIKASPNKYNNRLVTLTSMVRDKWEDIILSHGIEIERSEHCDRQHESQNRYRQKELVNDISEKNAEIESLEASISDLENKKISLDNDIILKTQSIRSLDDEIEKKINQNKDLDGILLEKQNEISALDKEISSKTAQLKETDRLTEIAETAYAAKKELLNNTQNNVLEAQRSLLNVTDDLKHLENEKAALEANISEMRQEEIALGVNIGNLKAEKTSLETSIKAMTEKIKHVIEFTLGKVMEQISKAYTLAPSDPDKAISNLNQTEKAGHNIINSNINDSNIATPVNHKISDLVEDAKEDIRENISNSSGNGRKSVLKQLEKNKEIIKARDEINLKENEIIRPRTKTR